MRVVQPAGTRGSLKWIQRAVNDRPFVLQEALRASSLVHDEVRWLSPLATDDYAAEYRDTAFLELVSAGHLKLSLDTFWPRRGPQWDALGVVNSEVLLVEAKAHLQELCSPATAAGLPSLKVIESALSAASEAFRARPLAGWSSVFYQLANRFAFLHFLNSRGVPARLALVNFVGDDELRGPASAGEWRAAYEIVHHVMGIPARHPYSERVAEVFVDVNDLE